MAFTIRVLDDVNSRINMTLETDFLTATESAALNNFNEEALALSVRLTNLFAGLGGPA